MATKKKARTQRRIWLSALAIAASVAGGGYYYSTLSPTAQAQEAPSVQTAKVRRGDLLISTTGAGTVIPSEELELSFPNGGELVEVAVEVGDYARAGQPLARIDDLSAREALASGDVQVAQAERVLEAARLDHEELVSGASEAELLDAQAALKSAEETLLELQAGATAADIAEAQATLLRAQESYDEIVSGPDADEVAELEMALSKAKNSLWAAQMDRDAKGTDQGKASGAYDQAEAQVYNAEITVQLAERALQTALEPATEAEIQEGFAAVARAQEALDELIAGASEAELAQAEADVARTTESLDELTAGATDEDLALSEEKVAEAELSVAQAELTLEAARQDLADTALIAPVAGTVTAVTGEDGEHVGAANVITLANVDAPMLEVFVDESDMDMVTVGNPVQVELDATPDRWISGALVQVDPSLVTEDGVQVIRGLVALDGPQSDLPEGLLMGMTAAVEIIAGEAVDAVLVPVEALRQLDADQYAVFVMEDDEPKMRLVEVGLQDYAYAEILSGLEAGEIVTTGIVEVK